MVLLSLINLVFAGEPDCPWAGAERLDARATATTVYVNGVAYPVRSPAERSAFATTLRACDADAALDPLRRWGNHRDGVTYGSIISSGATVGGLFYAPLLVGGLVGWAYVGGVAIVAPTHKNAMIDAIEASAP